MRRGKAADVRGAESFVAEALSVAAQIGCTGIRIVRADSKFYVPHRVHRTPQSPAGHRQVDRGRRESRALGTSALGALPGQRGLADLKTTTTDTDPTKPATNYHPIHDLDAHRVLRTRILGGLVNEYRHAA
jgi:hypothetical protein